MLEAAGLAVKSTKFPGKSSMLVEAAGVDLSGGKAAD
jgi:hypothetical protein